MNPTRRFILLSMVLAALLIAGCSQSLEPAATLTPTTRPTATPTETPRPTPTSTPTKVPSPTITLTLPPPPNPPILLPEGWRGYSTNGFSLGLPERWEAIDIDKEGIEAVLNTLQSLNTEWARNASAMFTSEAVQNMMKFWAMNPEPAGIGYASTNVNYQSLPYSLNSSAVCQQMPAIYKQMGIELLDFECGLLINGLDVARFTIHLQTGPFTVRQNQYVYVKGREMWSLTLAVDETLWGDYEDTFEAIARTFTTNPNDPFGSTAGSVTQPTLEADSRLLDEFEDPGVQIYTNSEGPGSLARCEYDTRVYHSGSQALRLSYDVIPEGSSSCLRRYLPEGGYADFSAAQGISFWYRSFLPDQKMIFFINIGDPGTSYSVEFTTSTESTSEWVHVTFGFDEFRLAPWLEEASETFDLTRVSGYGFAPAQAARLVSAVVWVDDVRLILK